MIKFLTASLVTLALAASVFAQAADSLAPVRVRGVAKEIKLDAGKTDAGTLVITVTKKDAAETLSFAVNADTSVKSGENVVTLSALKVGDKLRVDYNEAAGKKSAVKVRVEND
jgi:hypothetical protein